MAGDTKLAMLRDVLRLSVEDASERYEDVTAAVASYNDALDRLHDFVEDLHTKMASYYDEQTDAWRDTMAGDAHYACMKALEAISIEWLSVDRPNFARAFDAFARLPCANPM